MLNTCYLKKDYKYIYNSVDFSKRVTESSRIIAKYPDRIPVIVSKANNSILNDIDKNKFLVPKDLTIGQFVHVIRKRIRLESDKSIFIFINNVLPPTSSPMISIYEEHKKDDGFLYIVYNGESTFG